MSASSTLPSELRAAIERHWGFPSLRPLQEQAIRAVLDGRDSLVVLPTGGGKSLCYQAPAVVRAGLTVVVSPLISLMKDQVDGLTRIGVPAARLDSAQSPDERAGTVDAIRRGAIRLVFTSPERLVNTDVYRLLRDAGRTRSPWTRPTASATGVTTSGRNTGNWPGCASSSPARRSTATPRPQPSASGATSSNNSD